jgi:purine nucleosidase
MGNISEKRIIIDTDPGVDDAQAIMFAFSSPEVRIEALTTVAGNVPVENTLKNALVILELCHAGEFPVSPGASRALIQKSHSSSNIHGSTGLGEAVLPDPTRNRDPRHAVNLLADTINAAPGKITLVTIGPLTNLALAIRLDPVIASRVKEAVIMGGAIKEPGNVTPQAEFNIFADPHAAHIVFHSGLPITLVPLDVTSKVVLSRQAVEHIAAIPSPISRFFGDSTRTYLDFYKKYEGIDGCLMHDPLAMAVAFMPELVKTRELPVDVDISGGVSMGSTFADFSPRRGAVPNMKVALEVDSTRFLDLFISRIEALCWKFAD